MMTEYLRVTPTSEQLDSQQVPALIDSLHKLTAPPTTGLLEKLNPLQSETPPRFEFLALSEGADEPVEFYYGADDHLGTLEKRLQSMYPATFDIERVTVDIASQLVQPVGFTREEFIDHYTAGTLQYEFGPDEQYARVETTGEATYDADSIEESRGVDPSADHIIEAEETLLALAPPDTLAKSEPQSIPKPTVTPEGTVLARPATDAVSPLGVRWQASAARKQDWMTSLTPFTGDDADGELPPASQPGDVLASLVDHLTEATAPLAFQVVFQRRESWEADADLRKEDIRDGRDTLTQELLGPLLEFDEQADRQDRAQLSDAVRKRLEAIEAKNPKRSFTANIRAVGVPADDNDHEALDARLQSLATVFDPLDGPYYELTAERIRERGFRSTKKDQHARTALQRLLDGEITTGRGKTRPEFVLSGRELANFVVVPSSEQLTVEGTRGTRAEQQSRNPLARPHQDLLDEFREGMAVGYALDDNGEPERDPVRVPPDLLTTHYGRFASTGSGKSKAIINDALSLRETTGGPVVIVDPKGDGMCENYLRCHYKQFGGLDDVYHFRVPETLPAFSFFDIRPALEAGRNRENAIQDKVDHFHDILRMIIGRERYDRAFVANEIVSHLIKALFDEEYGSDVFGLDDLFTAVVRMQEERTTPPISAANQNIEESLTRHFAKDDRQFQTSMDAVGNRLGKLREDEQLRQIFTHTPTQTDAGEYIENRFDFREFLEKDATVLFDLGDLRPEAQRAITLLLLSNLWDAVQVRRRDDQTNYETLTNLIIEEAAPVAATRLVSEQLLPQGRSFGLSMGLVMQFPGQVRNRSQRAYDEVLNNIKTKFIGNISIERDVAKSLAHEDLSPTELRNRINTLPSGEWIAQLPSPAFGKTGPAPFSVKPLPIAPGHPESDQPLTEPQQDHFESVSRPQMVERTQAQYGITEGGSASPRQDKSGWGSAGADTTTASGAGGSSVDPTQSSFIGASKSKTAATADSQSAAKDTLEDDSATVSPLFGASNNDAGAAVADQSGTPENGSTPVQGSNVAVPDSELRRCGLSHDDAEFLSRVLDMMNREDSEYTLLDQMITLRDEFENLSVERLCEQDLLEEGNAAGYKYYTVLPAGRELLDRKLKVGSGQGGVGEKTPHKVGVRLLELWIQQQDDVDHVEPYYEYDDKTVFDVAGFDDGGDLVWAGEAELPSNNNHAPIDDYDKLSAVDSEAIWAFNNRKTAIEVLDRLAEAGRIEEEVSGRDARSFSTIRSAVRDFDAGGMTTVRGFKNLDREVNQ